MDGTSTGISGVAVTSGRYKVNDAIDIAVTFSGRITVTQTPRIALTIGGSTKYATYHQGTGSSTLTFRYRVASGDDDGNGIGMTSPIDLAGGSLNDASGAASLLIFSPPGELSGVIVDTTAPAISSVTVARGSYGKTANLDVTVNFSEAVRVTQVPRIVLDIGGNTKHADYHGGSNSSSLTFRYQIAATDSDSDGLTMTSSLGP